MKILMMFFSLLLTTPALANLEHADGMEAVPSQTRLNSSRACFDELDRLGCGRPADDLPNFKSCAADEIERVSEDCQKLIKKLFTKKR